ncbi:MAG: M23 family metallopeptidase [Dysgonamonadaceae bacterium]|jgi:lipoprotein NlpD|nr:M23 family metallopeptidase [Dysgonamonadaceae bacterium]
MAGNRNKNATFWKRIRLQYKLSFLNENTLEEVFSFRLSRLSAYLTVLVFVFLLVVLTSIVIIKTPIRNYLPGYLDVENRREIVNSILRADSLEHVLAVQSFFLNNVGGILRGDLKIDSVRDIDPLPDSLTSSDFSRSEMTTEFVRKYEDEERYNLSVFSPSVVLPDNLVFYRPVKGIISTHFNRENKHFGTDIATSPKESVLATLAGTVIFVGFDADAGNVIHLQHANGFVSIYKHNALLLKSIGDEVDAGDAIALVGNTGQLSTGTHLHFELWYKGSAVDPEEFIVF